MHGHGRRGGHGTRRSPGDLDGDGLLDLYVSLSHRYNVDRRMLFLSSAAKPGDLVGLVAEFSATGC